MSSVPCMNPAFKWGSIIYFKVFNILSGETILMNPALKWGCNWPHGVAVGISSHQWTSAIIYFEGFQYLVRGDYSNESSVEMGM